MPQRDSRSEAYYAAAETGRILRRRKRIAFVWQIVRAALWSAVALALVALIVRIYG